MERWGRSAHGSTYGGNPVACAAGVAVLETIADEGLVENAAARGAELRAGLARIAAEEPRIGDVRGPGLMIGVEFVAIRRPASRMGDLAKRAIARAADLGLLVLTCGSSDQVDPLDPADRRDARPRSAKPSRSSARRSGRSESARRAGPPDIAKRPPADGRLERIGRDRGGGPPGQAASGSGRGTS